MNRTNHFGAFSTPSVGTAVTIAEFSGLHVDFMSTANVADLAAASTTMDGQTITDGKVVWLRAQSTGAQNGPYYAHTVSGSACQLTRLPSYEAGVKLAPGFLIHVGAGTANGGLTWKLEGASMKTIGTDALTFEAQPDSSSGLIGDTVTESTAAAGVTVDGVLIKDNKVTASGGADLGASPGLLVDLISEKTGAAGVTVDGILLKDNKVTASGGIDAGATPGVLTDLISEKTGAAGVTIDGLLCKDGGFPVLMPGITSLQVVTGTLVGGTCTVTVGAGQTVTAATKAFPIMSAVVTGSTNFGCLAHLIASNVVGGSGVGQVVIRALGNDGAQDVDAAGLFAAILIN